MAHLEVYANCALKVKKKHGALRRYTYIRRCVHLKSRKKKLFPEGIFLKTLLNRDD